ncbi:hypothetical protein F4777DRAFT_506263 [Nemania sp. FL0916]|nr:hypothetical protein F4777DRAFT_506263 [Nemania sp. FL0916]
MAKTKRPATFAIPTTTRPYNALLVSVLAVASAAALWLMRIEPPMKGVPVDFVERVEARTYPDGTAMRTHYTGIKAVDEGVLFLIAAFAAGPLGWDNGVRLQQLHFIVQFAAVIVAWNVEACRARNSWKLISFTWFFALFYQTVGGAVIIPLYYVAHVLSSSSDAHHVSGRRVSLPHAKSLLLSVAIGYLIPSLAMYIPFLSASSREFLLFLWQPAPIFVNVLLFLFSEVFATAEPRGVKNRNPDVPHLKRLYALTGVVCTVNQLVTLYVCATAGGIGDPKLGFAYVFLPDRDLMARTTTAGLHYIFQIDWWGCFVPTLFWAWISVADCHRLLLGNSVSAAQLVKWALYILGLSLALGPGGMLAVVWSWREDRLVMIEAGVRGTVEKPKME